MPLPSRRPGLFNKPPSSATPGAIAGIAHITATTIRVTLAAGGGTGAITADGDGIPVIGAGAGTRTIMVAGVGTTGTTGESEKGALGPFLLSRVILACLPRAS